MKPQSKKRACSPTIDHPSSYHPSHKADMAAASTAITTTNSGKLSLTLKLLVDKNTSKVLFAEAGKDFVDFLFGLLALPIGTVVRLMGESRMAGSLGRLRGSLQALGSSYVQPGFDKDALLNPRIPLERPNSCLLLLDSSPSSNFVSDVAKAYYYCGDCYLDEMYLAESCKTSCPECKSKMTSSPTILSNPKKSSTSVPVKPSCGRDGYVKGVVTYMVMDDLAVRPMSTISSINLLNKFHVTDVDALEERAVEVDIGKGLKLLEVSLHSTTVLTDVLLKESVAVKSQADLD